MNRLWLGSWHRRVLMLLVGLALSACGTRADLNASRAGADVCARAASPVNPATLAPGLGGTGAPAVARARDPGGLGGTGQVAEGGLGGTGIVGVVTGFGSICVNGIKVDYAPDTPVLRDGRPVPQSELSVGQVVALQAEGDAPALRARHIAVLDAVVGPLGSVDAAGARFTVMGQAATALAPGDLNGFRTGQWVRVSGLRLASGEIRATRVQAAPEGPVWVAGMLTRVEPGAWWIGGTRVEPGTSALPAGLLPGQEVGVQGRWLGNDRVALSALSIRPTRAALGAVGEAVLNGYVHQVQGREVTLGFETLTLAPSLQVVGGRLEALRAGQPVRVRGRWDAQQRLVVDQLEFRREGGGGGRSRSRGGDSGGDDSSGRRGGDSSGSGSDGGGDSGSSGSGSSGSSGSGSSGQGRGRGRGG
jgi:hypothetical protein